MKNQIAAIAAVGVICVFSAIETAQAGAYQFQPDEAGSKDTFVYQFLATSPLEGFDNTILGVSKTSTGHDTASFVRFDLTSIINDGVTGGQVTSAKLTLRSIHNTLGSIDPSASFPVTTNVSALGADWVEAATSWSIAPAATGGVVASAVVNSSSQLVEFDITALVKDWLNGSLTNFGMRLDQAAEVLVTDEQSSDFNKRVGATFVAAGGAAADRPLLEITTVPEPSTAMIAGIACLLGLRFCRRRQK